HEPGSFAPETIAIPLDSLSHFEARTNEPVELTAIGPGTVQARWDAGVVPQARDFDVPELDKLTKFPDVSTKLSPADPGLLTALTDAGQSTARAPVRYARSKVQLRGEAGQIVATDGKHLLLQSGFQSPFAENVLVPIPPVFSSRELP